MITITHSFTLQGDGPFNYLFTTDNGSITFSNVSGTTSSNSLSTTITFPSEDAVNNSNINLTVTSSCGNSNTISVISANPCDNFSVSPISFTQDNDNLLFTVITSAVNCGSISYSWTYDTGNFEEISQLGTATQGTLRIRKLNNNVTSSSVTVRVTNACNGCEVERTYNIVPCSPIAQTVTFNFNRDKTGVLNPVTLALRHPAGCNNAVIDWSTLNIDLPSGFTYTSNGDQVTITPPANPSESSYQGSYTVDTTDGITSTVGIVIINIAPNVGSGVTITIPNSVTYLECDVAENDVVNIPIEGIVTAPGVSIDWNTFEVLGSPTPQGSIAGSVIFLAPPPGGVSLPAIQYTVPANFVQDVFAWTVADTNGNYMNSTVYTLSECVSPVTGVADQETVVCGSTTVIDVIGNDTSSDSPIDRGSIVITQAPTQGSHSVDPVTGNITYQAPANFSGSDTISYTVANVAGGVSAETTLTITIICAGVNKSITFCE